MISKWSELMLPGARRPPSLWGFGSFVFDRNSDQLYKDGERVRLEGKPLLLLRFLLEHAGTVVTREDLRQHLWPQEQSLEFDAGLYTAIKTVRQALGDTARQPVFIRTDRSLGYRFIHPIQYPMAAFIPDPAIAKEKSSEPATAESGEPTSVQIPTAPPAPAAAKRRHIPLIALAVLVGAAALVWIARLILPGLAPPELALETLTDSPEVPVSHGAISPDGRFFAEADPRHVRVVTIASKASSILRRLDNLRVVRLAWSGDSQSLFVAGYARGQQTPTLWRVELVGNSPPARIREDVSEAEVSPDATRLAIVNGRQNELWVTRIDGSEPRLLFHENRSAIENVCWSPRGRRLWIAKRDDPGSPGDLSFRHDLGSVSLDDTRFRKVQLVVGDGVPAVLLPDGRLVYGRTTSEGSELFELPVEMESGFALGAPRKRSNWPGLYMTHVSASASGALAIIHRHSHPEVWVAELAGGNRRIERAKRLTPEASQEYTHAWTPDGRAVIFESLRTGEWNLYRQYIDKEDSQPEVTGPEMTVLARTTPDGSGVLFVRARRTPGREQPVDGFSIMRAPLSGGPPTEISRMNTLPDFRCAVDPARDCVIGQEIGSSFEFSRLDPVHGPGAKMFTAPRGESPDWDLSPDGRTIAITPLNRSDNQIRVFSETGVARDVAVQGWSGLASLTFWANGQGFFAASMHSGILDFISITMQGNATRLDFDPLHLPAWIVPSRDGRRVALNVYGEVSKAWLIRRF